MAVLFLRALPRPTVLGSAAALCVVAGAAALVVGLAGPPWSAEASGTYGPVDVGIEVSRSVEPAAAAVPVEDGEEGEAAIESPPVPGPAIREPLVPPAGSYVTPGERLGIAGCSLFPRDHAFHASIGALEVHPDSDSMLAAAGGAALHLDAGFSAKPWDGARAGYPVNLADSRVAEVVQVVAGQGAATSDLAGHPMPTAARIEGWPSMRWDRHLLVVDPATCRSHEMIGVTPPSANPLGAWMANKAVIVDLDSNAYRPGGTVKVSGISMLAGLVRYDEVAAGRIDHVLSMGIPSAGPRAVWPARASDGPNPHPDAPPMGTWLRLRADTDLSSLGPQAAVVARALRDHGGVLADTGGRWVVSGEPDVRWDDADLNTLRGLTLEDFEVVDPTPMMTSRDSLRIR